MLNKLSGKIRNLDFYLGTIVEAFPTFDIWFSLV